MFAPNTKKVNPQTPKSWVQTSKSQAPLPQKIVWNFGQNLLVGPLIFSLRGLTFFISFEKKKKERTRKNTFSSTYRPISETKLAHVLRWQLLFFLIQIVLTSFKDVKFFSLLQSHHKTKSVTQIQRRSAILNQVGAFIFGFLTSTHFLKHQKVKEKLWRF